MLQNLDYDFIVVLSEEFLNRTLDNMFEESVISHVIEGKYALELPKALEGFGVIDYKIIFTEPFSINALRDDEILLGFGSDLQLMFTILVMKINLEGVIKCTPVYNYVKNQLELKIKTFELSKIKVLESVDLPNILIVKINEIVAAIIESGLNRIDIPIAPIIGSLALPEMPKGNAYLLPVRFGRIEIIDDKTILLGFNIIRQENRTKTRLEKLELKNDIAISFSESCINKVVDFWWTYTTHLKSILIKDRIKVENVEELVNYLSNYSIDLLPKILTLGFVEFNWNLLDVWLDYEGKIVFTKPLINITNEGINIEALTVVDITGFLRVDLEMAVEFDTSGAVPDFLTPWEDDRIVGKSRRIFEVFRYRATDKRVELVSSDSSIKIDNEKRIILQTNKFDINVGLNWRLPRRIVKNLEKRIEKQILISFPNIPISPSLIRHQIEDSSLLLDLEVNDIIKSEDDITVHANVDYRRSNYK